MPRVNTAKKGRRAEHRSRALLEAAGYTVIRAAASKGDFDLVGYSATAWVLYQVKAGRPPGPMERRALAETTCPPGTLRLIHVWPPRARLPETAEL